MIPFSKDNLIWQNMYIGATQRLFRMLANLTLSGVSKLYLKTASLQGFSKKWLVRKLLKNQMT